MEFKPEATVERGPQRLLRFTCRAPIPRPPDRLHVAGRTTMTRANGQLRNNRSGTSGVTPGKLVIDAPARQMHDAEPSAGQGGKSTPRNWTVWTPTTAMNTSTT
jgi:hypothetical protein